MANPSQTISAVMLVDDDDMLRGVVRRALVSRLPNPVLAFGDGPSALQWARSTRPAVAVLDVDMEPMNGLAIARELRQLYPDIVIVFLTGSADEDVLAEAATLQPAGILNKPLGAGELAKFLLDLGV